ncbi:2-amino-4-hydroxy-6-hydroxymethyldihydropteridine diphosphokinase [Desulfothermobacter acidiphilus]|uniref:2-amino-4-hydroxy-6- hydroxymethyldihydropteridine diphosphokinase n=1 Tax=Desulfothermobacter acidiphilus TaxID=1938353 RepID=UPI003F89B555
MPDRIHMEGLWFSGKHGVLPEERDRFQAFRLDLLLYLDLKAAGHRDELYQTINYQEVYQVAEKVVTHRSFLLLEALAQALIDLLWACFPRLRRVRVRVDKPGAPLPGRFERVGVELDRYRRARPVQALIGLGSNLGDKRQQLQAALAALRELPGVKVKRVAPLYRSSPWGKTDQPPFYNTVALISTYLSPFTLLAALQSIEWRLGRRRQEEERWGPRPIDLDLLLYGNLSWQAEELTLPHPRLAERAFVVVPLAALLPELVLPNGEKAALWAANLAREQEVEVVEGYGWESG